MKKLYEKNEITFTIVWIVIYCVVNSFSNSLNEKIGIEFASTVVFCIIQAVILVIFLKKNNLFEKYKFCKPSAKAKSFLFYIPLIIISIANLSNGVALNYSLTGTICHFVGMLFVGFLEELIFRGFLFTAMAKKNVKSAIIVSSVTFGIGHIINLINGSGMSLVSNLCQIFYAVAFGFLVVTIFHRGGSIIPCILAHSAVNSINTFSNGEGVTTEYEIARSLIMAVFIVAYTLILTKTLPKNEASVPDVSEK